MTSILGWRFAGGGQQWPDTVCRLGTRPPIIISIEKTLETFKEKEIYVHNVTCLQYSSILG